MDKMVEYVQGLISKSVLVRLDNGGTVRGTTISIDDHCNVLLVNCEYALRERRWTLGEALIRGNHILFLTRDGE